MIFNEQNKADWEEIAKYLSDEMNKSEKDAFEQRLGFSDSNAEYFKQVKTDWGNMNNLKEQNMFDTDKAWGKLYNKFEEDGLLDTKSNRFKLSRLAEIAAIFIIGILLTTLTYYMFSDTEKAGWQVVSTYEDTEIKQVELVDGSIVYLNANSKVYYPENFEGNTRTIEFEGDGFFEIAKNPAKPFIIKAKNAEIKVLGTSFNVNTKKGENKVEVLVETGMVELTSIKDKQSEILEPGYLGRLYKNKVTKEKNLDKNYLSWKTRVFNFEDVPFNEVIEALNRSYNADIEYDQTTIRNVKLYTPLINKPLDTVLQIICETKNLTYKKEGNNIVLTKK